MRVDGGISVLGEDAVDIIRRPLRGQHVWCALAIPTNNRGVNHDNVVSDDCLRVALLANHDNVLFEDLYLPNLFIIKERPGELEGVFHFLDAQAKAGV